MSLGKGHMRLERFNIVFSKQGLHMIFITLLRFGLKAY